MTESHSMPSSPAQGRLGKEKTEQGTQRRPWPVRALTLLLVAQGVALVVVSFFSLRDVETIAELLHDHSFFATLPPLGVLAGIAAIGFYQLRPGAWVMAMLVQGLILLVALVFYFRHRPDNLYLYGLMAGGAAGVDRMFQIVTEQMTRTMRLLGVSSLEELEPGHVKQLQRLIPRA